MKALGQIKIEEGLTLNNPSLEINAVIYDWSSYDVLVQCIFTEENSSFKHSRDYVFSSQGSGTLTSTDIINFVKGHETLKVFS